MIREVAAPSFGVTPEDAVRRMRGLLGAIDTRPARGRVLNATGTIVRVLMPDVRVGEICVISDPRTGWSLRAEVVGVSGEEALLTPIGELRGLSTRAEVLATGRMIDVPVGEALLGRVLDGLGEPVDGRGPLRGHSRRPLHGPPPPPLERQLVDRPMPLGVRVMDGLLTCGMGQRMGIYGEAGGGKSTLVSQIVRGARADVAVIAMIGERGREVREFLEHSLGEQGLRRSVVVVATSERPAAERLTAAYAATAMAEHFRDQGLQVLLFLDNVTRFARALREIGLAAGEPPARRGFPPSVFSALPLLMERAGPGARGSITAFYAVLVDGDGAGDPVAEETRGILDGHIILSRKLASAGHYPAIDVLTSRSRVMNNVVSPAHRACSDHLRALLARHAEIEFLLQVGEFKAGADALSDEAAAKIDLIRAFLRQGTHERTEFQETTEWMTRLAA